MTVVACHVPNDLHDVNLWDVLKASVRRAGESADGRLIVADSKQIYSTARGWDALEKSALSAHGGGFFDHSTNLENLLQHLASDELPLLRQESWFVGNTPLPTEVISDEIAA